MLLCYNRKLSLTNQMTSRVISVLAGYAIQEWARIWYRAIRTATINTKIRGHTTTLNNQKTIHAVVGARCTAHPLRDLADEGDDCSIRRFLELRHPDNDHMWLWALSKHKGPALEPHG